jgi:hypothetical protein
VGLEGFLPIEIKKFTLPRERHRIAGTDSLSNLKLPEQCSSSKSLEARGLDDATKRLDSRAVWFEQAPFLSFLTPHVRHGGRSNENHGPEEQERKDQ